MPSNDREQICHRFFFSKICVTFDTGFPNTIIGTRIHEWGQKVRSSIWIRHHGVTLLMVINTAGTEWVNERSGYFPFHFLPILCTVVILWF